MLDEVIVIAVFLGLAASAVLALRSTAASFRTAAATLVLACLLTPAVWLMLTKSWSSHRPHSFPLAPPEPFADYLMLYLPMSFFVATLVAAALAVGLRRVLRVARTASKPRLGKP